MLKRFRCYLFGCDASQGCECERCGTHLYDNQQAFRIEPCWLVRFMQERWYWIRRFAEVWIGRKCDVCGKRYWGGDRYTCSDECGDKWVPF